MIFGMSISTYTLLHVLLSLVGIVSGVVVLRGLLAGKRLDGWTIVFLASAAATSVTGFGFPVDHLMPSHIVGVISLVALGIAIAGRYAFHLLGVWRQIYVIGAMIALYLDVFVGVVQAFEKIPALKAIAPKQSEPPFVLTQLLVLSLFVVLTIRAAKGFRRDAGRSAASAAA
jgi:hypothetical protein